MTESRWGYRQHMSTHTGKGHGTQPLNEVPWSLYQLVPSTTNDSHPSALSQTLSVESQPPDRQLLPMPSTPSNNRRSIASKASTNIQYTNIQSINRQINQSIKTRLYQGHKKQFDIGPANPFPPSYPLPSFPFIVVGPSFFPPLSILPLPSIFASLPLEVGTLNPARGSGAEPQRKSNLVHFSIKSWHLMA